MCESQLESWSRITLSRDTLFRRLLDPKDEEAWRLVSARYAPLILALARKSGLSRHHAEDAQQEALAAFVQAVRAGRVDPKSEGGNPTGYLFKTAWNKIADFIRDGQKQPQQVVDEPDQTGFFAKIPTKEKQVQIWEEERRELVKEQCWLEAQKHFTPMTFHIYVLRVKEKRSSKEVAAMVGKEVNAVDLAVKRVRAFLDEIFPIIDSMY
jgi:RNA polymerase sigma factor (sigma-70 family)